MNDYSYPNYGTNTAIKKNVGPEHSGMKGYLKQTFLSVSVLVEGSYRSICV